MIKEFLRYILGKTCVKIDCSRPEDIINEIIKKDYMIRNIKKHSNNEFTFECSFFEFKKISCDPYFSKQIFTVICK